MISAVVFDLYGTLVGAPPVDSYAAYAAGTATRLGFDPLKFPPIYDADYEGRQTGRFGTHEQYLRDLAQRLGVRLSESQLTALVQFRVDTVRSWLIVKTDAVSTLRSLRARGLRLGLVSDCGWETGLIWPSLSVAPLIDVPVLSYEVGVKKPNPRIFEIAVERLGVPPGQCLYVGDGGSDELAGARRAGMVPIMIDDPKDAVGHRPGYVAWSGPRIASLAELLSRRELGARGG